MNELYKDDRSDELGSSSNELRKLDQEVDKVQSQKNKKKEALIETEADKLNHKILKITLIIKAKFPELSKFLDEVPRVVPNSKSPQISITELKNYYQSLEAVMNKYKLEHPDK